MFIKFLAVLLNKIIIEFILPEFFALITSCGRMNSFEKFLIISLSEYFLIFLIFFCFFIISEFNFNNDKYDFSFMMPNLFVKKYMKIPTSNIINNGRIL